MADDDKERKPRKRKVSQETKDRLRDLRKKYGLGEFKGQGTAMRAERGQTATTDSQVAMRKRLTGLSVVSVATQIGSISIPVRGTPVDRNPYEAP